MDGTPLKIQTPKSVLKRKLYGHPTRVPIDNSLCFIKLLHKWMCTPPSYQLDLKFIQLGSPPLTLHVAEWWPNSTSGIAVPYCHYWMNFCTILPVLDEVLYNPASLGWIYVDDCCDRPAEVINQVVIPSNTVTSKYSYNAPVL